MKIRNLMLALAGTALVFSACEKDPNPKVPTTDANIALATILPNPDGMTGAAYPQLIRDEGTIFSFFRDTWAIARTS